MKKKIGLGIILLLICMIPMVNAKGEEEEELENFVAGESVVLNERIGSTAFIAGNMVDVQAGVDGASFIAGNAVNVSNTQDYLFVAGNNITISGMGTKDAFVAGNSIQIKESAVRDFYASGSTIRVESPITRNAYLAGDVVIINSEIKGDVYVASDSLQIGEKAVIGGTLKYPKEAKVDISKKANIANTKTYKGSDYGKKLNILDSVIIPTIISYVSLLLIAFILLWVRKKDFDKVGKAEKTPIHCLKMFGIGFVGLIVIPVAAFIMMLTLIGIPLGFIVIAIYSIFAYLSFIPTSFYLGKWFLKDKIKNNFLLLTVSLFILYIIKMIPYLGGFISFIAICIGFGFYVLQMKEWIKIK
ncbi:MAG: hypothetical protein J6X28_06230 [Bacilli bacterium]|nr:hypothetical protein [Bacilli bacterium]